jgi:hypothetical protein
MGGPNGHPSQPRVRIETHENDELFASESEESEVCHGGIFVCRRELAGVGETSDARQPLLRVQTVNETDQLDSARHPNIIEVRIPTNIFINVYRTNQSRPCGPIINVYRTNWTDWTETRVVAPVDVARTNFVTRYQTNLNTLTFTNWETVLVMKTNRVTKRVPNVVEIDLSRPAGRGQDGDSDKEAARARGMLTIWRSTRPRPGKPRWTTWSRCDSN